MLINVGFVIIRIWLERAVLESTGSVACKHRTNLVEVALNASFP